MTSEEYLRSHFEARCKVKQRYRSAQAATRAARFKEVKAGHPLYIYRCPVCAGWHLTKNSKKDYDLRVFTKAMDQALGAMLISRMEYDTAIREFKKRQELPPVQQQRHPGTGDPGVRFEDRNGQQGEDSLKGHPGS